PVAFRVHVAERQVVELAQFDLGDAVADFARHELPPAQRALMVEENSAATEDAVTFAIIDGHPVGVEFGDAVRAARVERRGFRLRNRLHLAEHFGCAGLIEADLRVDDADRFEQVDRPDAGYLGGCDWLVERYPDKALRREIVDFGRLRFLQEPDRGRKIREIMLDEMEIGIVLNAEFLDPPEVDRAGAPVSAVDSVALRKQQLSEVRAVLARDPGYDCGFHRRRYCRSGSKWQSALPVFTGSRRG